MPKHVTCAPTPLVISKKNFDYFFILDTYSSLVAEKYRFVLCFKLFGLVFYPFNYTDLFRAVIKLNLFLLFHGHLIKFYDSQILCDIRSEQLFTIVSR